MAYRPKPASYYFRENKQGMEWLCTKFLGEKGGDSSSPTDTYILRNEGRRIVCSCPAAWGGRKSGGHESFKECKHIGWFERWRNMYSSGRVTPGVVTYYNSTDDRFYPVPGFAEVDMVDLQQPSTPPLNEEEATEDGNTEISKGAEESGQKEDGHPGAAFMRQNDE